MVTRAYPVDGGTHFLAAAARNIGLVRAVRCKLRIVRFSWSFWGLRSLHMKVAVGRSAEFGGLVYRSTG